MSTHAIISCPACDARLKIKTTIDTRKKIRCPGCKEVIQPGLLLKDGGTETQKTDANPTVSTSALTTESPENTVRAANAVSQQPKPTPAKRLPDDAKADFDLDDSQKPPKRIDAGKKPNKPRIAKPRMRRIIGIGAAILVVGGSVSLLVNGPPDPRPAPSTASATMNDGQTTPTAEGLAAAQSPQPSDSVAAASGLPRQNAADADSSNPSELPAATPDNAEKPTGIATVPNGTETTVAAAKPNRPPTAWTKRSSPDNDIRWEVPEGRIRRSNVSDTINGARTTTVYERSEDSAGIEYLIVRTNLPKSKIPSVSRADSFLVSKAEALMEQHSGTKLTSRRPVTDCKCPAMECQFETPIAGRSPLFTLIRCFLVGTSMQQFQVSVSGNVDPLIVDEHVSHFLGSIAVRVPEASQIDVARLASPSASEPTSPEPSLPGPEVGRMATIHSAIRKYYAARIRKTMDDQMALIRSKGKARLKIDPRPETNLSWRVYLLPHIGEDELFAEFRLNEPWDSDHNKALIPKMPDAFECVGHELQTGRTVFLRPDGPGTVLGKDKDGTISLRSGNGIVLLEVMPESSVEWTKPQDLDVSNPADALKRIGAIREGRFLVNSGQYLPADIDPDAFLKRCQ